MIEIQRDWNRSSKGAKIGLLCLVFVMVAICVYSTLGYMGAGDYKDAEMAFPTLIVLILWKVVYPFCLGAAARKRGGSFGAWFFGAMFLGIILIALMFWVNFRKRPVLPEYVSS